MMGGASRVTPAESFEARSEDDGIGMLSEPTIATLPPPTTTIADFGAVISELKSQGKSMNTLITHIKKLEENIAEQQRMIENLSEQLFEGRTGTARGTPKGSSRTKLRKKGTRTFCRSDKSVHIWQSLAEEMYALRSKSPGTNKLNADKIIAENEELFAPILERFPEFSTLMSFVMVNNFGFRVKNIDWDIELNEWGFQECKDAGKR